MVSKNPIILILLIINAIIISSCYGIYGVKKYIRLPDDGIRPKKNHFSFVKHPYFLTDTSLIDTNTVYILTETDRYIGPNHYDNIYSFYRFFGKGQLFISNDYFSYPTYEQCNNLTYGTIGYYKIVGKEIIIEVFSDMDFGSYLFYYGYFDNKKIVFNKWKPRGTLSWKLSSNGDDIILIKSKVGKLNSRPNW